MAQLPNLPAKTLGGKQMWADLYLYGGWRVQRHVVTQHCRLLDEGDVRRAWGTEAQCEAALESSRKDGRAKLRSSKLCILIHGYLRAKDSLNAMKLALEKAGFEVYAINYPSSWQELGTLASSTSTLLQRVSRDFEEVNVVTHSMGGIIARKVLAGSPLKGNGRLVMLAPPNQGAHMADLLLSWWPSQHIAGPAGKELVTQASSFARNAGTPGCPFLVIAGGRGDDSGYNPALPGDDDGVVSVQETQLEGATAHVVVPALHTFLMNNEEAIRRTVGFLQTGSE